MVHTLLQFLRSLRLTIALLALLAAMLALSTLPGTGSGLIGSPLFWLLLALLALNTLSYTLTELWRHPPQQLSGWGAHLIHLGLLFLLAGLSLSLLLRDEEQLLLSPGEAEQLKAGIRLELVDSTAVHNQRGDLINWESTLRIQAPGREPWKGTVAVHRPLRISPYRLYQTDFETRPAVRLLPKESSGEGAEAPLNRHPGGEVLLAVNEGFREGDTLWVLSRDDGDDSRDDSGNEAPADYTREFFFLGYTNGSAAGRRSLSEGAEALGLEPAAADSKILSRLRLAYDPGALPAAVGAVLLGIGAALYGIQHYKRCKRRHT